MIGVFDVFKIQCIYKCDLCCCRHQPPLRCISCKTQHKICLQYHGFYLIRVILFSFVSYYLLQILKEISFRPPSDKQFYHLFFRFHLHSQRTTLLDFISNLQMLIYATILYYLIEPPSQVLTRSQICPFVPTFSKRLF